jgi:hypothetical protein
MALPSSLELALDDALAGLRRQTLCAVLPTTGGTNNS